MPNAYIRFLNVVNAMDRKNPSRVLDKPEIQLLEYVMQSEGQAKPLLVGDLISLDQYGSQATLHGRLKNLVALGFIRLVTNTDDCRKKSILPTKLALKYIQFMSDCLNKSIKK